MSARSCACSSVSRTKENGGTPFTILPEGGYPNIFTPSSSCDADPGPYRDEPGWAIDWPHEYRQARFDLTEAGVSEDTPLRVRFTFRTNCRQCFLPQGWWIDDAEVFTEILDFLFAF